MLALPVNFIRLLKAEAYVTFLAEYEGKKCVVKFFTEESAPNNEYDILTHLKVNSSHSDWYPRPYFRVQTTLDEYVVKPSQDQEFRVRDIYQVIGYEYFEGLVNDELATSFDITKARKDLLGHLSDIHNQGFIVADINCSNIIYNTVSRRYQLIDYGMTFHVTDPRFKPLDFIRELSPTQKDDRRSLEISLHVIEGVKLSLTSKYDIGMILHLTLHNFNNSIKSNTI